MSPMVTGRYGNFPGQAEEADSRKTERAERWRRLNGQALPEPRKSAEKKGKLVGEGAEKKGYFVAYSAVDGQPFLTASGIDGECGRIVEAPVNGHAPSGKNGTGFPGVVAERDDEVEFRSGQIVDALRLSAGKIRSQFRHDFQSQRINALRRGGTGGKGLERGQKKPG